MVDLQKQISMCARHHAKWRRAAAFTRDAGQRKRYLERALFWLDTQTELVALWSADRKNPENPQIMDKVISDKANLSRKLAEYTKGMLDDMKSA